jgi:hypothetical protein
LPFICFQLPSTRFQSIGRTPYPGEFESPC